MDPTGGWGLKIFVALVIAIALLWWLAPHAWALGISIALAAAFVALMAYVISHARFT